MTQKKHFGTDGIRGRVGASDVNPEFFLYFGWAVGRVLANADRKHVLIGKDTRISGYMLESALEAGLSAAGVDVTLLGPMPTPGIAYLTQTMHAAAGIVISASHNPFEDNGIKFFSAAGSKLPDDVEIAIEQTLTQPLQTVVGSKLGKARRMTDAPGRYIEFCKSSLPPLTKLTGIKIVVDCAHGATYHMAPNVYAELGASVVVMGNRPDGFNINAHCGSTAPASLQQAVLQENADLGIALDGDGDRVILVDANGNLVNGDQILYALAKNRIERGVAVAGVVGTVMSNFGLEKILNQMSLPFIRTQVGDRYVLETLRTQDWLLGGEPSGHVVCLDKTTTGDGIIVSLQIISCMMKQACPLADLVKGMDIYPQVLLNVKTDRGKQLLSHPKVCEKVAEITQHLQGEGRIVLRPSGTEPVLRVMVEGLVEKDVTDYAHDITQLVQTLT